MCALTRFTIMYCEQCETFGTVQLFWNKAKQSTCESSLSGMSDRDFYHAVQQ